MFADFPVRSDTEECLSQLILFGEASLHRAFTDLAGLLRYHPAGVIVLACWGRFDYQQDAVRYTSRAGINVV
jgi:hypothetical protein